MSSRFSLRVLHIWTIFENPLIVYRRKKLLFQRLLMNLQLFRHYNLIKIQQLFTQTKEVLLFLLPMIWFLSWQKDPRLLLCHLKSLSLTLLPYLLDVTLNVFTDHWNDSMNNTCECFVFFLRKRKRCSEWTQREHNYSIVLMIQFSLVLWMLLFTIFWLGYFYIRALNILYNDWISLFTMLWDIANWPDTREGKCWISY